MFSAMDVKPDRPERRRHNAEAVAQKRGGEVLVAVLAGQVGDRHQVTDMLDEQHKRDGGDDQDTVQAPGGSVMLGNPIQAASSTGVKST